MPIAENHALSRGMLPLLSWEEQRAWTVQDIWSNQVSNPWFTSLAHLKNKLLASIRHKKKRNIFHNFHNLSMSKSLGNWQAHWGHFQPTVAAHLRFGSLKLQLQSMGKQLWQRCQAIPNPKSSTPTPQCGTRSPHCACVRKLVCNGLGIWRSNWPSRLLTLPKAQGRQGHRGHRGHRSRAVSPSSTPPERGTCGSGWQWIALKMWNDLEKNGENIKLRWVAMSCEWNRIQFLSVLHSTPFKLHNVFTVSDPPARGHQRLTLLELQLTQRMRSLSSGASDLKGIGELIYFKLVQIWFKCFKYTFWAEKMWSHTDNDPTMQGLGRLGCWLPSPSSEATSRRISSVARCKMQVL